ncbi:MAG: hypothetical protein J2O44_01600 [Porphyrobacter sp.]|nr:hypothetical protein [Porphyrobacter sp.]
MTDSVVPGRVLIGTMHGFSGTATGQTHKIARRNVLQVSGVYDASLMLMKNALICDTEDDYETRTGLSITPEPTLAEDPDSGVWTADLEDATLKVWVEHIQRADRRFEQRASQHAAKESSQRVLG